MGKRGNLFVVSGPSGVGKGTLCEKLMKRRDDIRLSVSCTTRAPRPGEVDGLHYFFVSDAEFDRMIEEGQLLEYAQVHAHRYGTPRPYVEKALESGYDVILEIDVQGGKKVMNGQIAMTSIFILPPSREELVRRLVSRATDSGEQIKLRIHNAAAELRAAEEYDYLIVNKDLEQAVTSLEQVICAQRNARPAQAEHLDELYKQFQEVINNDD